MKLGRSESFECPILLEAQHLADLSGDMLKSLRRLRRKLHLCQSCEHGQDCPALAFFRQQVNAAIELVAAEWEQAAAAKRGEEAA